MFSSETWPLPKCNVRSSNTGILISDDDCWRVSTSDGSMRIIYFRHINTSIADPVQHPNRQGRLERSEDMPSRHSTHWWGTSQELRSWLSGQSHTLRRAYQESEVVDIQAGRYQQSTIYKQEYSGTQMFTRSDGSISESCHQATSRP